MSRPSFVKAIKAKCRDCMNDWADGRINCQVDSCPLYHWQPFREGTPTFSPPVLLKNPRRVEQGRALAAQRREAKRS